MQLIPPHKNWTALPNPDQLAILKPLVLDVLTARFSFSREGLGDVPKPCHLRKKARRGPAALNSSWFFGKSDR